MRILYFGIPLGAVSLAEAGFSPAVVCAGPLDLPGRRRLRRRLPNSLLLGLPNLHDEGVQRALRDAAPDLTLSFFWPRQIPPAALALAPALGTHPSLLPRWRGPDPYYWAIRSGDRTTGVTLHRLDESYDTGHVVATREVDIDAAETSWSLARKLDRPALALLLEAASRAAEGDPLLGTPQPDEGVTHAPAPSANELAIDWTQPAHDVDAQVRAAAPAPGATAEFGATLAVVLQVEVTDDRPPVGLVASEAWRSGRGWCVRCGEGAVRLLEVHDSEGALLDLDAVL
ncbi:MAG: formyltransferase family protein [Myxococcota bacterium]